MSDAMTNREIEDVLTSIRRLVAQDGARPAPVEVAVEAQVEGRLILTEAQRIAPVAPPSAPEPAEISLPAPDFHRLEATIAELEAAVAASGGTWEGESPEDPPRASNVTELYTRVTTPPRPVVEVVEAAEAAAQPVAESVETVEPQQDPVPEDVPAAAELEQAAPPAEEDEILDEEALRAIVAQIVREELQGQLGERITAQVRKLVRAEIARALDERRLL